MKKNKRVLMVGSDISVRGGMTTVVNGFINRDFEKFDLIYIPTHIEDKKNKQILFFIIAFIKIIFTLFFNDISIVHIHVSERGSFIRKNYISNFAKLLEKKVIIHMHGAEFKEFYNTSNENVKKKIISFLKKADKVIVLGESWNEFVKGLDRNIKTVIMPNFVKCIEEKAKFNSNEVKILFLGVLIKRKGIFDLVEAIKLLLDENINRDIKVIVAGSGIEEERVKEEVIRLNMEKYFEFIGWIDDSKKREILKGVQIFTLPSYNEGLPVAILEAMSYGLPIISTSVGSIEDAVINEYNGIIIEPGNIVHLKKSIKELIYNHDKWKEYSLNSKKIIKDNYNEEDYFVKISNLYEELI